MIKIDSFDKLGSKVKSAFFKSTEASVVAVQAPKKLSFKDNNKTYKNKNYKKKK